MTGIPFMVTQAMKAALHARGVDDDEIAQLTPEQAHEILATPDPRAVREFNRTASSWSPTEDGLWLVVWRGHGWLHGSRADARDIAVIHYAKIIAPREGGAA